MKNLILISSLFLELNSYSYCQSVDSINCYIQLQDLYDLDLNKASVKADFYLTMEYTDPQNNGLALLNGTPIKIDTLLDDEEMKTLVLRMTAELRTHFSLDKFPLDNQKIEIKFEAFQQVEKVILFSNPGQNIVVDNIHLNGWQVQNINCLPKTNKYRLTERSGIKEYLISSLTYEVPIIRENKTAYFIKAFLPCLISILIIYIGFILYQNQIDLRVNLAVGSLFVIISNFIVTQRSLPNVSEFTLIEKINIGSLFIVFTTILFFVLSFRFKERFTTNQWVKINRWYIILTTALLSLILVILLV